MAELRCCVVRSVCVYLVVLYLPCSLFTSFSICLVLYLPYTLSIHVSFAATLPPCIEKGGVAAKMPYIFTYIYNRSNVWS